MEGPTTERPTTGRHPFQPEVYGDRWAPALVAWSDPEESPQLAGEVVGSGGSTPLELSAGGPMVYVTGLVVLDGPQVAGMLGGPSGRDEARAVIMHELGHLVGLGHVEDPTQLMHGDGREGVPGVTAVGPGDLSGFAGLRAAAASDAAQPPLSPASRTSRSGTPFVKNARTRDSWLSLSNRTSTVSGPLVWTSASNPGSGRAQRSSTRPAS